jgi:hypothetical protein
MPRTIKEPINKSDEDLSQESWFNLVGYCKALVELDRQAKESKGIYNNEVKELSNEVGSNSDGRNKESG